MADSHAGPATSRRAHRYIQWVLRGGLVASTALVAAGLAVALVTGESSGSVVRLGGLVTDSTVADRIIALGLMALAVTPIVRVAALAVIWTARRDRRFVALSLTVAAILAASILSGWRSSG